MYTLVFFFRFLVSLLMRHFLSIILYSGKISKRLKVWPFWKSFFITIYSYLRSVVIVCVPTNGRNLFLAYEKSYGKYLFCFIILYIGWDHVFIFTALFIFLKSSLSSFLHSKRHEVSNFFYQIIIIFANIRWNPYVVIMYALCSNMQDSVFATVALSVCNQTFRTV